MSKHDDDTCPHLVRASLLEAENARLKAEVARLYTEVMNLEENSMSNEYYAGENDKENARLKAEVERLDNLVRYWSEKYQNENARFLRASERIAAKEGKPSV